MIKKLKEMYGKFKNRRKEYTYQVQSSRPIPRYYGIYDRPDVSRSQEQVLADLSSTVQSLDRHASSITESYSGNGGSFGGAGASSSYDSSSSCDSSSSSSNDSSSSCSSGD